MDYINTKTLLIAYKQIPRMLTSLDKCVKNACNSGFGCFHFAQGITTYDLFERIIDYTERKKKLILAKNLVENSLEKMNETLATILYMKHIENHKFDDIAVEIGYSIRSVYRLYNKALSEMNSKLILEEIDDGWINSEWYLSRIKSMIIEEEKKSEKIPS